MAIGAIQIGLVAGAAFLLMRSRKPRGGGGGYPGDMVMTSTQPAPSGLGGVFGSGLVLPGSPSGQPDAGAGAIAAVDDGLTNTPITNQPPEADEPPQPPDGDNGDSRTQTAPANAATAAEEVRRAIQVAEAKAAKARREAEEDNRYWRRKAAREAEAQARETKAAAEATAVAAAATGTSIHWTKADGTVPQAIPIYNFPVTQVAGAGKIERSGSGFQNVGGIGSQWAPVAEWERDNGHITRWPTAAEGVPGLSGATLTAYKKFRRDYESGMRYRYKTIRLVGMAMYGGITAAQFRAAGGIYRNVARLDAARASRPAQAAQRQWIAKTKAASQAAVKMFKDASTAEARLVAKMSHTIAQYSLSEAREDLASHTENLG